MNISKVIEDALRGKAPRPRERQPGGLDLSPPGEFLAEDIWSLLRKTRHALEAKGFAVLAIPPPPGDDTQTHTLLIMESWDHPGDGCWVRFMLQNGCVAARLNYPGRDDRTPIVLDPPGSITLVQNIIEDFLYHCLTPSKAPCRTVPCGTEKRQRMQAKRRLQTA